jgi:Phage integrase family
LSAERLPLARNRKLANHNTGGLVLTDTHELGMTEPAIVGPFDERIRHTTATYLLRAGVDINTIRAWLGHVSIDPTNVYAEVDLETKAQMFAACGHSRREGGQPALARRSIIDAVPAQPVKSTRNRPVPANLEPRCRPEAGLSL